MIALSKIENYMQRGSFADGTTDDAMIFKENLLMHDLKVDFSSDEKPEKVSLPLDEKDSSQHNGRSSQPITDDLDLETVDLCDIDISDDPDSETDGDHKVYWDVSSDDEDDDEEDSFKDNHLTRSIYLKDILTKVRNSPIRAQSLESSEWMKKCMLPGSSSTPKQNTDLYSNSAQELPRHRAFESPGRLSLNVSVPNLSDDSAIRSGSTSPETSFHNVTLSDSLCLKPKHKPLLSRRSQLHSSPNLREAYSAFKEKRIQNENVGTKHKLTPLAGNNLTDREKIMTSLENNNSLKYTGDGNNQTLLNKFDFLYMGSDSDSASSSDDDLSGVSETEEGAEPEKPAEDLNLLITMHDKSKAMKSVPTTKDDLSDYFVNPDSDLLLEDELNDKMSRSHWVDFTNLRLVSLPPSLTTYKHVQALRLDGNWIRELPEDIAILDELQCISIRSNYLYCVPQNLERCQHLQWLSLEDNKLVTLPDEMSRLQTLSYLNLKKNSLKNYPKVLNSLVNLSVLDLSENNHLYMIAGHLKHLKNLTWLSLHATLTMSIPSDIDQCAKLQYLDISHNHIRRIPDCMKTLHNLKFLHMGKNSLYFFPEILCEMTSLELIDISLNNLSSIPEKISNLDKLKSLNLENNSLRTIPPSVRAMRNLSDLNTSGNRIKRMD